MFRLDKVSREGMYHGPRKLRAFMNALPDVVIVHDLSGNVLFANAAAAKTYGFATVKELVMHATIRDLDQIHNYCYSNGRPFLEDELPSAVVLSGERDVVEMEAQYEDKEGRTKW